MTNNDLLKARIQWKCRRGMLELDKMIGYFYQQHFQQLTQAEQQTFESLLELPDKTLWDWLLNTTTSDEPQFQSLINKIQQAWERRHV